VKQNEKNRYSADTCCGPQPGTITVMFNSYPKGAITMKTWIKRSLIGLASVTVLLGATACGHRGDHARGWSEERITEVRGKVIDKVSSKLELNQAQQQKLGVLADEMIAARKAVKGNSADPRADLAALIATDTFNRTQAQALLDQKTQAMQGSAPKVLAAFGDFYDSLTPAQQQQVREKMNKRGHGWWGRG
jgi:Spy/CpxP family protein refolding chaperone